MVTKEDEVKAGAVRDALAEQPPPQDPAVAGLLESAEMDTVLTVFFREYEKKESS